MNSILWDRLYYFTLAMQAKLSLSWEISISEIKILLVSLIESRNSVLMYCESYLESKVLVNSTVEGNDFSLIHDLFQDSGMFGLSFQRQISSSYGMCSINFTSPLWRYASNLCISISKYFLEIQIEFFPLPLLLLILKAKCPC